MTGFQFGFNQCVALLLDNLLNSFRHFRFWPKTQRPGVFFAIVVFVPLLKFRLITLCCEPIQPAQVFVPVSEFELVSCWIIAKAPRGRGLCGRIARKFMRNLTQLCIWSSKDAPDKF